MKTFIIYRRVQVPGNQDTNISYLKAAKGLNPIFTTLPSEARAVGWLPAIWFRIIYRFSVLPVMQRAEKS